MNARLRDFDPATDDGEHGWLQRGRDQAIQDCKDDPGTALMLLEPKYTDQDELARAVRFVLLGGNGLMRQLIKKAADRYADERAPELARKLYRIANQECGE